MRADRDDHGPVSVLMRDDIDTDQIIPKQFLKRVERTGFGEFLFYDWAKEPGWDLPVNPILVAGKNFGCGSSREHAPWALEDYGFRADHRAELRRHLPLELHEDRPAAGRAESGATSPRSPRRASARSTSRAGGALAGRGHARLRDRRGHEAPAAERPRRHRPDAAQADAIAALRARARAAGVRRRPDPAHEPADWDAADLRPRLGAAGRVVGRDPRPPRAARRRGRPRRRLRVRARDRAAARAPAAGRVDRASTARRHGPRSPRALRRRPARARSSTRTSRTLDLGERAGRRRLLRRDFHWVLDHDELFARLAPALRPGRAHQRSVRRRGQHRARCRGIADRLAPGRAACARGARRPGGRRPASACEAQRLHATCATLAQPQPVTPPEPLVVPRGRDPRAVRAAPARGHRTTVTSSSRSPRSATRPCWTTCA